MSLEQYSTHLSIYLVTYLFFYFHWPFPKTGLILRSSNVLQLTLSRLWETSAGMISRILDSKNATGYTHQKLWNPVQGLCICTRSEATALLFTCNVGLPEEEIDHSSIKNSTLILPLLFTYSGWWRWCLFCFLSSVIIEMLHRCQAWCQRDFCSYLLSRVGRPSHHPVICSSNACLSGHVHPRHVKQEPIVVFLLCSF